MTNKNKHKAHTKKTLLELDMTTGFNEKEKI